MARELNCDRGHLLALRRQLQDRAFCLRDRMPLDDPVVETDELYQNAGEQSRSRNIQTDFPHIWGEIAFDIPCVTRIYVAYFEPNA